MKKVTATLLLFAVFPLVGQKPKKPKLFLTQAQIDRYQNKKRFIQQYNEFYASQSLAGQSIQNNPGELDEWIVSQSKKQFLTICRFCGSCILPLAMEMFQSIRSSSLPVCNTTVCTLT
jgi:hypothetical protein